MAPAPAAHGGSAARADIPLRTVAISALILASVLAAGWAFLHHPIPEEAKLTGPWSICGTPIAAPFEVRSLDPIVMEDDAIMFGIRDGQGRMTMVSCPWTRNGADPERLFFHARMFAAAGTSPEPQALEITHDRDLVRNLLFYAMAHRDFHARAGECRRAYQLYPSCFDRLRSWLQGHP